MKKKIFTLCLFASFILNIYSQAPESFQYQAIVSDNNTTLVNTDVSVRFTIREKTATGTKVYSEVHQTKTNSFGMVALQVGKGPSKRETLLRLIGEKELFSSRQK